MNLIRLQKTLLKPLVYITIWLCSMMIIIISVHDTLKGIILLGEVTEVLMIGYGLYVFLLIGLYFWESGKK